MKKHIKRILSIAIIAISIFTLIGCQSKDELKQELKQEIKAEEVKSKVEETSGITKESLIEFETLYEEYKDSIGKLTNFKLQPTDKNYITIEQSKELKLQSEILKENIIQLAPKILKEDMKKYISMREELVNAYYENREEEWEKSFHNEAKSYYEVIKSKLVELHTQVDNK